MEMRARATLVFSRSFFCAGSDGDVAAAVVAVVIVVLLDFPPRELF